MVSDWPRMFTKWVKHRKGTWFACLAPYPISPARWFWSPRCWCHPGKWKIFGCWGPSPCAMHWWWWWWWWWCGGGGGGGSSSSSSSSSSSGSGNSNSRAAVVIQFHIYILCIHINSCQLGGIDAVINIRSSLSVPQSTHTLPFLHASIINSNVLGGLLPPRTFSCLTLAALTHLSSPSILHILHIFHSFTFSTPSHIHIKRILERIPSHLHHGSLSLFSIFL